MRVALISTFYGKPLGGAEISIGILFDSLLQQRLPLLLLTCQKVTQGNVESIELSWIPNRVFILGNAILDSFLARRYLQKCEMFRPTAIHVQDIFSLPAAHLCANTLGIPLVATIRDNLPKKHYFLGLNLFHFRNKRYKNALNYCSSVVAISNSVRGTLIELGVPATKIEVIYNAMPELPLSTKAGNSNDEPLSILACGRFHHEKGFDVLLDAFEMAYGQNKKLSLKLVGRGPEGANLKRRIANFDSRANIQFSDWVKNSDLIHEMRLSDIVVLPSRYPEPLGRVLLEAGMLGKAIITSNAGGTSEVLDASSGIFVSPGDIPGLSSAIVKLSSDEKLRISVGKKARANIESKFSVKAVIPKWISLYEHLK